MPPGFSEIRSEMKKLVVTFAAVAATFAIATGAFAQAAGPQGGAPGQMRGGMGRMNAGRIAELQKMQAEMMTKLGLTPDQKKKVDALTATRNAKMKSLLVDAQKPGADRQKLMDTAKGIRQDYNKGLQKILTKDQQKKLVTARKEMMEKFRSQSGPGRGAAPKAP